MHPLPVVIVQIEEQSLSSAEIFYYSWLQVNINDWDLNPGMLRNKWQCVFFLNTTYVA